MSNYANPVLSSRTFPNVRVLGDTLPGERVRDVLLVIAGAGLVGLLAQITFHLSFTPVPITAQTLGVLVVGTSLGLRRGTAALVLYAVAGLIGRAVVRRRQSADSRAARTSATSSASSPRRPSAATWPSDAPTAG